jgi:hypothetical protein
MDIPQVWQVVEVVYKYAKYYICKRLTNFGTQKDDF